MALFRFLCNMCEREEKKLKTKAEEYECGYCSQGRMEPQLPRSVSSVTNEVRDPYRGKSLPKGHDKMMKKRMNDHHDRHDAERKIDEFGIDDAIRLGWTKKVKRI